MVTFSRARGALLPLLIATACAGCSREQQDWQAAEAIHTREAYARFIEQHADSELLNEARARMAQLDEEHDWARADASSTLEAYRGFLAQHPRGPRAEQARIRIEGFSLGSAPRTQAAPLTAQAGGGVSALQLMHAPPAPPVAAAAPPVVSAAAPASAPPESASPERIAPAPPAAADPAATVTRVGADGYGVQLGAFGSEASADREWQRLRARFAPQLGGLSARIVVASAAGAPLYRLQAPATGEAQARALCDSLREQDQSCVPVIPR